MKHTVYLLALACSFILLSCNDKGKTEDKDHGNDGKTGMHNPPPTDLPPNSMPTSIDTANKMLQSYLNSINAAGADTNLTAVIFNADTLRKYLNDTGTTGTPANRIAYVKLMFAHTLNYVNNGGQNQNCGYSINGLTLLFVGYNSSNNYVYNTQGCVIDRGLPCPHNCPPGGSAASYMLPHVPSQGDKSDKR